MKPEQPSSDHQPEDLSKFYEDALAGADGDVLKEEFERRRALQDKWANDYKDIFPQVRAWEQMTPQALGTIASYAKKMGIGTLKQNHFRYFTQPWGIVGSAMDVYLVGGTMIRYPGHLEKISVCERVVDRENLAKLRHLLKSDAFRQLSPESPVSGIDGCSILIEADIDGNYSWKCHWGFRNKVFIEIANALRSLTADK